MSYRSPYDPSSHGSRLDPLETRAGYPDDAVAIAVIQSDWLPHSMADLERVAIRDLTDSATPGSSSYISVAEHEGLIVGYANCKLLPGMGGNTSLPHAWYLTGVNVPQVWRRQGIGRALIAHRLDVDRGHLSTCNRAWIAGVQRAVDTT